MPGMPPMPPMPPGIPPPPPLSVLGLSTIMDSDVVRRPATDAASRRPVRVTLAGSMMPASYMLQ